MSVTVNIDTGGTFTDGVFTRDGAVCGVKVLTTPHDLTVGMLECIEAGADAFDLTLDELVAETEALRFSSTIATNLIIERRGPAVGLLVDAGETDSLYGERGDVVEAGLVRADLVEPVGDPYDQEAVAAAVERLLDRGARVLVVSLDGSWDDPAGERSVRDIVRRLYPAYFLGAVRVFLASDLSVLPGTAERTNVAVLNAYVHERLARNLYRAEEDLRRRGLRRPLLLVEGNAGLARTAKSLAIGTYNSGPVAGVFGAANSAATGRDGVTVAVTLDVGGTSADVSIADDRGLQVGWTARVAGIPVHLPSIEIDALAVGGGTIAWLDGGSLRLGPHSAGAFPGPACFDRGGAEPTVTDVNLVLGYLAPDGFHGGRLPLSRELAERALSPLAAELGVDVVAAARRVRRLADETIAAGVTAVLARRGVAPEHCVLVAYGGGGPLHAAGVARLAGIPRLIVPPHAAVFSALGVSGLDVRHRYPLLLDGEVTPHHVAQLVDQARRDMVAEGFAVSDVRVDLEVVDPETSQSLWHSTWPGLDQLTTVGEGVDDVPWPPDSKGALLVLTATADTPHADVSVTRLAPAERGETVVDWGDGPVTTARLAVDALAPGTEIDGPALVTGPDTVIAVPPRAGIRGLADGSLEGWVDG